MLILAYKAYVRPILEYGTPVFNPQKCKLIALLEKVQNNFTQKPMIRALGFLFDGIPSSSQRNANFKLLTLASRRRKFDLILFHKILNGVSGLEVLYPQAINYQGRDHFNGVSASQVKSAPTIFYK